MTKRRSIVAIIIGLVILAAVFAGYLSKKFHLKELKR